MIFTERQQIALQHPAIDDLGEIMLKGPTRPHEACGRREPPWFTVLEVRCLIDGKWMWIAGVSRSTTYRRSYRVSEWKPGWREEAMEIQAKLLDGIGECDVDLGFTNAQTGMLASLQRWRRLTDAEIDLVARKAGHA